MPTVVIVGTLDTKGPEFAFLKDRVECAGCGTTVIDVGVLGEAFFTPDISREEVAKAAGESIADLRQRHDRGNAVNVMAKGAAILVERLYGQGKIDGIVSLGGSAGTAVGTDVSADCLRSIPSIGTSGMHRCS